MHLKHLFLLALFIIAPISQADESKISETAKAALEQIRRSPSVAANSFNATEAFAKKHGLTIFSARTAPQPGGGSDSRFQVLYVTYLPEVIEVTGTVPEISVEVYFNMPTHFERTLRDRTDFTFYRTDVIENTSLRLPRQPAPAATGHN